MPRFSIDLEHYSAPGKLCLNRSFAQQAFWGVRKDVPFSDSFSTEVCHAARLNGHRHRSVAAFICALWNAIIYLAKSRGIAARSDPECGVDDIHACKED